MIYDVTIAVSGESNLAERAEVSRQQLWALGITKITGISSCNRPGEYSQTWRVFVDDEKLGVFLALKFDKVSTAYYNTIVDNLRQVEEEYAIRKATLLSKINGDEW